MTYPHSFNSSSDSFPSVGNSAGSNTETRRGDAGKGCSNWLRTIANAHAGDRRDRSGTGSGPISLDIDPVLVSARKMISMIRRTQKLVVTSRECRRADRTVTKVDSDPPIELLVDSGQTQLHSGQEVFQDASSGAFVVGPAAMALIDDDDDVEEVRRIVTEIADEFVQPSVIPAQAEIHRSSSSRWLPACAGMTRSLGHEGLEDREEQAAVLRHLAFLFDLIGGNANNGIFRECRERIERLIGQRIAVSQEQDARSASRFFACFPVGRIPATLKQLPRQLKRDEGLASSGGQSQQDTILACGDGFQNSIDGDVLVVASLKVSASIFERHRCESITPGVLFGKGPVPEFVRGWKVGDFCFKRMGFMGGMRIMRFHCPMIPINHIPPISHGVTAHVHRINAMTIGEIRPPNRQLFSVALPDPLHSRGTSRRCG